LIAESIRKWIRRELYCKECYSRLSSLLTDNPYALSILETNSRESGEHAEALRRAAEILGVKLSPEDFKPEMPEGVKPVETHNMSPVEIVYQGIKQHLKVEVVAREAYERLAEQVENLEAKEIFRNLAKAEEKHHKMLTALLQTLEQTYPQLKEKGSTGV